MINVVLLLIYKFMVEGKKEVIFRRKQDTRTPEEEAEILARREAGKEKIKNYEVPDNVDLKEILLDVLRGDLEDCQEEDERERIQQQIEAVKKGSVDIINKFVRVYTTLIQRPPSQAVFVLIIYY